MRVYDTNHSAAAAGSSSAQQTSRTESGGGKQPAGGVRGSGRGDEVQLSAVGSGLAAQTDPAEREARIQKVSALYQSGSYRVDAAAVSEKLVDDAIVAR